MLEVYVKENYYARFDTRYYQRFKETHFNARFDVKSWQSHWSAKSTLTTLGHSARLKIMSMTITMKGLTLTASAQSDQGLSTNRIVWFYRMFQWRANALTIWNLAHVKDSVNMHILLILKGTFSLGVTAEVYDCICRNRPRNDISDQYWFKPFFASVPSY